MPLFTFNLNSIFLGWLALGWGVRRFHSNIYLVLRSICFPTQQNTLHRRLALSLPAAHRWWQTSHCYYYYYYCCCRGGRKKGGESGLLPPPRTRTPPHHRRHQASSLAPLRSQSLFLLRLLAGWRNPCPRPVRCADYGSAGDWIVLSVFF